MRKIKRTLLIIALSLILLSLSAVAVFATNEAAAEPKVAIKSFALNIGDAVHIKVSAAGENLPDGSKIQILVWNAPQSDYTINSENAPQILNPYGINESNGRTEFYYTKISAMQMTDNFYFVACVKCNGEYIYSSVQKYSVLQYTYNKKNTSDISLKNLLSAMLEYGAMAQIHFGISTDRLANDTYYKVTVSNGLLDDGQKSGLFLSTDRPTITANEAGVGFEFIGWENSSGMIVSTDSVYTLPSVSAEETYTAKYDSLEHIEPTDESYFEFVSLGTSAYAVKAADGVTLPADLVIPAYHNGMKVTAISDGAFASHPEIKRIRFEFSNVLTDIGNEAFKDCANLLSFAVPSAVSKIGNLAFDGCYRLVEVYNRSGLGITAGSAANGAIAAFALDVYTAKNAESKLSLLSNGCIVRSDDSAASIVAFNSTAASLTLPDDIYGKPFTVNAHAFAGNTTLKTLDIGIGLTAISEYAFKDATALNYVIASDESALAHIGAGAFDGCIDLTSIYIAEAVDTIGANAFKGCVSLTVFTPLAAPAANWSEEWNCSDCDVMWNYEATVPDAPVAPVKE